MVNVRIGLVAKLLVPLLILFVGLTYAISMLLLNYFAQEQLERTKSTALSTANEVAMMFDTTVEDELLKRMVTILALNDHVERVYMVSPADDTVLASSQYRYASHQLSQFTDLQKKAYFETKNTGVWNFTQVYDQRFVLAYPITAVAENKISTLNYVLVITIHTQIMDNQYAAYRQQIVWVSSGFLIILIALVYALIHRFVRYPISVFKSGFQQQREEEGFHPITLRSGDEFEDIADEFNRMQVVEQRSLKEAQKAADASKALADKKSQFLANMSHELRTPINGILGIAQLCQTSQSKSEIKHLLGQLITSSHHLLSVVNDILDFSKLQEGRFTLHKEKVNLSQLIIDVTTITQILADNKGLEFRAEISPASPFEVSVDKQRVTQVLLNLLNNAVKFTEHGQVSINVGFRWLREDFGYLDVAITDSGIGISDEQLSRLFTPFEQADTSISRHFGGTGLGLAICKELLRLMEGDIDVESRPFEGSTFYVSLPIDALPLDLAIQRAQTKGQARSIHLIGPENERQQAIAKAFNQCTSKDDEPLEFTQASYGGQSSAGLVDEAHLLAYLFEQSSLQAPTDTERQPQTSLRILLAEDNDINAMVAKTMLENLGHKVMHAKNGEDAVKAAKRTRFDVIFMDIQMPILDGYVATTQIRSFDQTVTIVGLSANIMAEDRARAFDAGMNAYLGKPILIDDLVSTLRAVQDTSQS